MNKKRNIAISVIVVFLLAIIIELVRSDFVFHLNKNTNVDLLSPTNSLFLQMDPAVFERGEKENYLIIYDSSNENFIQIKDNFVSVLKYIKVNVDFMDVHEIRHINDQYDCIVLLMEDLGKLQVVEELMAYVFDGGNVFFGFRLAPTSSFNQIYRKIGILEYDDFIDVTGIKLHKNLLIKGTGFSGSDEILISNSSLSLRLEKESISYAESTEGVQLLWQKAYGQGHIMYFNGTMLQDKINRGIILGALSFLNEDFIYPVINTKVTFIDDFPAPIPEGSSEKITKDYNRTIKQFFQDIWWPDMLRIAARNNILYTGVVIGTYDDNTQEISEDLIALQNNTLFYYSRELLSNHGEIGIHGYNHQPFFFGELHEDSRYKPWPDRKAIEKSLVTLHDFIKTGFKDYTFRVYVPPSNILYPEGREALAESATDIKIISSLYVVGHDLDSYEQEFEVADDGMIEFPRLTSGYTLTQEKEWLMMNGVTLHGTFSHFIHPDDILDGNRNDDKDWHMLSKEYTEFHEIVYEKYSWLRSMTASQGANALIQYTVFDPKYQKTETSLTIYSNYFYESMYFILRTGKTIGKLENCEVKEIDEDIYLVKVEQPYAKINYR